jgi:cation diffusion facilitator family transporter
VAGSSRKAIWAALVGNSLIAVTKFGAAAVSGSAAMFAEGVHSVVDTGNQVLLLYGLKRAARPADERFPLGYGKEIYFWSFVVAMLIFGLGATVSLYNGWHHLHSPPDISNLGISYAVLVAALVFEGGALWVALREFSASKGPYGWLEAVRRGKDPSLFVVVFEDAAAMLGLCVALAGLAAFQITGNPVFDALASIVIGFNLAIAAIWLAYESKGLLIGESANPELVEAINAIVREGEGVNHINELLTLHMGPEQIIVVLSVDVESDLDSSVVKRSVTELNRRTKALDPRIVRVFVEVEDYRDHHVQHARAPRTPG